MKKSQEEMITASQEELEIAHSCCYCCPRKDDERPRRNKNYLNSVKGPLEEKFTVMEGRIDDVENKFEKFKERFSEVEKKVSAVPKS